MTTTRRQFLASSAALLSTAAAARAIEPIPRKGQPTVKLSLAAYSMRDYLQAKPGKKGAMDLLGFLDYCAEQGLAGAELTSYYFPKEITSQYLMEVKRRAHLRGLAISGGAIANDFCQPPGVKLDKDMAHTKQWIDYYADLGAPVIRIFAGHPAKGETEQTAIDRCIENCDAACGLAGKRGVMLALENHGGITTKAETMLQIVRGVKSDWFGVNFDSGNFRSADPYAELALIAPYAINAQLKVSIGARREKADFARILKILRDAQYTGWIILEYEEKEDPYTGVPAALAKLRKAMEGY